MHHAEKKVRRRFAWLRALTILVFCLGFVVSELGQSGRFSSVGLYRKIYPALRKFVAVPTDLKYRLRGTTKPKQNVVIVDIDMPSIDAIGRWPWRRDFTSLLIERVFQQGARVVGLDIVFTQPEERVPEELAEILKKKQLSSLATAFETDPILQKVVQKHSNRLVLGWFSESACQPAYASFAECPVTAPASFSSLPEGFEQFRIRRAVFAAPFQSQQSLLTSFPSVIPNIARLNQVARYQGYLNATPDVDSVLRRNAIVAMVGGQPHPSLALEMARLYRREEVKVEFTDKMAIKNLEFLPSKTLIPVTPAGLMEMNFRGGERTFPYVSALDVLDESKTGETSAKLRDAAVIIGVSALGAVDFISTPFDQRIHGVEGHATALDNLLANDMLIPGGNARYAFSVFAGLLIFMSFGVAYLALKIESHPIVPTLLFLTAATLGIIWLDARVLFANGYNLNTGFLYAELFCVSLFSFWYRYVIQELKQRIAEQNIFRQTMAKERAEKKLLLEGVEKARMKVELQTAQLVQETILKPHEVTSLNTAIAYYYQAASECGGDIWDVLTSKDTLRAFIGDATGHGVSAAIVTAVIKSCIGTLQNRGLDLALSPAEALRVLNQIVYASCRGQILMTMSYLELDETNGKLTIASAGHEAPLWISHASDTPAKVELLFARGERLGFHPDSQYKVATYQLQPGDTVVLYTDGVTEATNKEKSPWGERAFKKTLVAAADYDASTLKEQILAQIQNHTQGEKQPDDITFLILQWKPKLASKKQNAA